MINLKRLLAPLDYRTAEGAVVGHACALAEKYGAELHLLHVVDDRVFGRFRTGRRHGTLPLAQENLETLPDWIAESKVKIRREVRQGSPSQVIVEYARDHDIQLILLARPVGGSVNDRAFRRIVNQLLDASVCPVLILGGEGDEINQALIHQSVLCLHDRFGAEAAGPREETRRQMRDWLVQELRTTDEQANQLLGQMESSGILAWQSEASEDGQDESPSPGKWNVGPIPAASAEDPISFQPVSKESFDEMSPALSLLRRGFVARATDVHIDPDAEGNYAVRFRVDGRIEPFCTMQRDVAGSLIKQLKLLADISLADPFQPSESRLQLPPSMARFEVRITTAPVFRGQAIALRIIDRDKLHRPLNELGLSPGSFTAVYRMLHRGSGLVLIAGPTGAGKTTTAYSMLKVLVGQQQTIMSIEDPVELIVPFIRQLNVDERHGVTMKVGLSTLLRMDPDVVFVGEVRNMEAAETAVQAACCGKRVFSTMHMRDVSATVSAMRELNIDSRSLADNLTGIMTQRLVRRLCPHCRESVPLTDQEAELFVSEKIDAPAQVRRPRGCAECRHTGYRDRLGIFEAVAIEGDIAQGIREGRSEHEVRQIIRAAGTPSLLADGLLKVHDGITTVEEVQEMTWVPDASAISPPDELWTEVYERGVPYKRDGP